GDGKPDLALLDGTLSSAAVGVLINNGDGTFAAEVDYPAGWAPTSLTVADLNGDGKPDLAAGNYDGNYDGTVEPELDTVSVLLNDGDGTFAAAVDYLTGLGPNAVVAADLDGDGKPDLVTQDDATGTVSVLLNDGDGTFAAGVDYPAGDMPLAVVAADLDGDGKPDLAVTGGGVVNVLLNEGKGTFAAPVGYSTGGTSYALLAANLNGDGK